MTRLAREIAIHVAADQGPEELLRRLWDRDPSGFRPLNAYLASTGSGGSPCNPTQPALADGPLHGTRPGVTTTVTGALKEGIRDIEHDLKLYALGGKGATSRKTPHEILDRRERLAVDPGPLLHASRMAAKVDNAFLQDRYQLYHHAFFFTGSSHWCVVQQGMNDGTGRPGGTTGYPNRCPAM